MRNTTPAVVCCLCLLLVLVGQADAGTRADLSGDSVVDFQTTIDMPLMAVGNLGNAPHSSNRGGVDYAYNIGKYEVTAGQYTEFLNATAATDTYNLYNAAMVTGCGVVQSGSDGSYAYSVAADWADRPVNYVSWGDAARLVNWLTNGMPSGGQDLATTEDGSYFLNGATSDAALLAVTREVDAHYTIPTEDEWQKAAYHKNDGVTGNYFDNPMSSDDFASNTYVDPDPGNTANFYGILHLGFGYMIDAPYYRTEVGEFENSASPYGTFDQGGNVREWTEAALDGTYRSLRGASYDDFDVDGMLAASQDFATPTTENAFNGFRIAEVPVPEPATMSMLGLGALAVLRRRKK